MKDRKPRTPSSASSGNKGNAQIAQIRTGLNATIGLVGTVVSAVDEFDGRVILENASGLSESLVILAQSDPKVRKVLLAMVQTSAWTPVAISAISIMVPILAHHKLIPGDAASFFGKTVPVGEKEAVVRAA